MPGKSQLERTNAEVKRYHKMPDGDAEETRFPKANPGQVPYLEPRDAGPKISSNTGNRKRR